VWQENGIENETTHAAKHIVLCTWLVLALVFHCLPVVSCQPLPLRPSIRRFRHIFHTLTKISWKTLKASTGLSQKWDSNKLDSFGIIIDILISHTYMYINSYYFCSVHQCLPFPLALFSAPLPKFSGRCTLPIAAITQATATGGHSLLRFSPFSRHLSSHLPSSSTLFHPPSWSHSPSWSHPLNDIVCMQTRFWLGINKTDNSSRKRDLFLGPPDSRWEM